MTAEMSPETTWFRNPYEGYAGTLNLCFNALDRQVIRGKAAEIALYDGERTIAYAGMLEQVSALAGVLGTVGVGIGDGVELHLADPVDQVLMTLAVSRIGAVLGAPEPRLVATSEADVGVDAPLRLLRGVEVTDERRELAWEHAVKAGREGPAACVELPGTAAAFVVGVRVVEVKDGLADVSVPARIHAILASGRPLDVRRDLA